MPKPIKILALSLATLLVVIIAAAAYLAATFDPNEYKPMLVNAVQEKTQRTLTIPGDIKLSFFPKLGADLGQASLTEKNSQKVFASFDSAQVSLALIPLLSRQLVVDRVRVDGLRATIRRERSGATNFDDLVVAQDPGKQPSEVPNQREPLEFDIAAVEINNAEITVEDRQQGQRIVMSALNLKTGKIAPGVPSEAQIETAIKSDKPKADLRVKGKTGFTLYPNEQRYVLKGLDAEINGAFADVTDALIKISGDVDLKPAEKRFALERIRLSGRGKQGADPFEVALDLPQLAVTDTSVSGGKFSGEAKLTQQARRLAAAFSAPSFEGSPQAFRVPALEINASLQDAQLDMRATLTGVLTGNIDNALIASPQMSLVLDGKHGTTPIKGKLQTPLAVDLSRKTIDLPQLAGDFSLPNPGGGSLSLKAAGRAGLKLAAETASADLEGSLDQSPFKASLGMKGFGTPAYSFNVSIDRLDMDRYRTPTSGSNATAGAAGTASSPSAPASAPASGGKAEQAIDLSALRTLRADGSLRVGALKAAGIRASNVRVDLHAAGGKLEIQPMSANLYGGTSTGGLTLTASSPPRLALRQSLSGVNVGPLLKDALGQDRLEGRGNVQIDVTSAGATVEQIKRGLNGSARMELRDGSVRGVNIAQAVRGAKSTLDALRGKAQAEQSGTASSAEKTDFSELSGSFNITNGVARNDDLDVKSPLIRIAGSGEIDLAAGRLDYVARTTVVRTLQGQGGPELQALKGLTVPVRLSGPFDAIDWKVDVGSLVTDLARQKLDEKKDEAKAKIEKSLEDPKEKLKEELREQLRGLFRK